MSDSHTIRGAARRAWRLGFLLLCMAGVAGPATAQQSGSIVGRVTSAETDEPVAAASVLLVGTNRGTNTEVDGSFRIGRVPPGEYTLRVSALGYATHAEELSVTAGGSITATIELSVDPVELHGIRVSVLSPNLTPQGRLEEREIREANPVDTGELLRSVAGVEAVRRGPINQDPVVRGLRETEVGAYLDDTRLFPAGPARMDSPLSHVDPSAFKNIEVVKGPYALTWGAGNLSAIRTETQSLPPAVPGYLHGTLFAGFDSNREAAEAGGSFFGEAGAISYWGHGVYRDGNDYQSGNGTEVPGEFRSWEGRGKVGLELAAGSSLTFAGGYQDQGPIDYPGRLLNAEFFEAVNLSGRWSLERTEGALRSLDVLGYYNKVDHGMSNRGKPTAEDNPDRTPPFALDVGVDTGVEVVGGRAAATFDAGDEWSLEIGGDVYSANRDALRTIQRQSDGQTLLEDRMWPDATITDAGVFAKAERPFGAVSLAGTVRLDFVQADADSVSDFYLQNTTGDVEASETNLSGALTVGFDLSQNWALSLGLGSAVRTADANERYSDRIPATKAQLSNEFMGNPELEPERSTQGDLWLQGSYARVNFTANLFARKIDDYITIEATDLPTRLPLSPEPVYRHVNGEATFWGFESSLAYALLRPLTAAVGVAYLWGEDDTLDEPALGVAPFTGSASLRWDDLEDRFHVETRVTYTAEQNRVAEARGEIEPSEEWATVDVQGGVRIARQLELRLGVQNLTDTEYVNHLAAKNPFTGDQIPEPGRIVFADVVFSF